MSEPAVMLAPIVFADGNMLSSNVPENDHPAWASGTTYALGARVILTSTHKIYQSNANGNVGRNPATDDGTWWVVVGSTNRWRAFDASIGQKTAQANLITYEILLPREINAIGFVGLEALSVSIQIRDPANTLVYDETTQVLDVSGIANWFDFFTYDPVYETEIVVPNLDAVSGSKAALTITNTGGTASISEIVLGQSIPLGIILDGSRSGFTDYSRRDVDGFGNISIVKRPTARKAEWELLMDTRSNRRIQMAIENARGSPALFYTGDGTADFYLTVFGVVDDFFPSLSSGPKTQFTLSLTGVS